MSTVWIHLEDSQLFATIPPVRDPPGAWVPIPPLSVSEQGQVEVCTYSSSWLCLQAFSRILQAEHKLKDLLIQQDTLAYLPWLQEDQETARAEWALALLELMHLFCIHEQALAERNMDSTLRLGARLTNIGNMASARCPDLFHQICTNLDAWTSASERPVQEGLFHGSISQCITSLLQFVHGSCRIDYAGNSCSDWDASISGLARNVLGFFAEKASCV
jgi:hypothetical protein